MLEKGQAAGAGGVELFCLVRCTGQLHFVPPVGPLVFKICSFCWLLPLYLGDGGAVYNSTVDSCLLAVYLRVCVLGI